MASSLRSRALLTRRRFVATAASSLSATVLSGIAKPYLSRAADRPLITHGVQSGDVSIDAGMVWARADRPSRMLVEVATTDSFKEIRSAVGVDALPETDFTAKALIEGLPPGQDIFYRMQRGRRRRAAGDRLYREGPDRGATARAGHLLSHPVPGSRLNDPGRAADRALSDRAERSAGDFVHLVGRHRRTGLGHR
jgi:phosphodiesterase/alkaline phosphatase D-like protein